jgi:hypothetical protein
MWEMKVAARTLAVVSRFDYNARLTARAFTFADAD